MTIPDEHIRSRSKQTVALCMPDSADPHEPLSPWECVAIRSPAPACSLLSSFPHIISDILCQLDFRAWEVANLENVPQIKKQRISPLLLSGLYPPPGTLPNPSLLQREFASGAGGERSRGVAHHSICGRAESTHARRVDGLWGRVSEIA